MVDDGSTDGTAEELDRLADEVNAEGADSTRMCVVRTENRGVAAARNTGAARASAPLIAFLDSDDLWLPHKLERQVAFMDAHPECAIAQTEEIWVRGGRRVNPGLRHRKRAGGIFRDSLRTCLISPSAVILRNGLFRELGGFDERMAAAEDYDLWLRILVEQQVGLIAEALVMRRAGHPGQLSATVPAIDRFRLLTLIKLLDGDQLDRSLRLCGGNRDRGEVRDICSRAAAAWPRNGRNRGDGNSRAREDRGRGTRAHIAIRFDCIDGDDYRQRCIRNRSSA